MVYDILSIPHTFYISFVRFVDAVKWFNAGSVSSTLKTLVKINRPIQTFIFYIVWVCICLYYPADLIVPGLLFLCTLKMIANLLHTRVKGGGKPSAHGGSNSSGADSAVSATSGRTADGLSLDDAISDDDGDEDEGDEENKEKLNMLMHGMDEMEQEVV